MLAHVLRAWKSVEWRSGYFTGHCQEMGRVLLGSSEAICVAASVQGVVR